MRKKKFLSFSFVIFFTAFLIFTPNALADTHITGDIETNTTWTLSGSPYVVDNDIYINSESTLTIEPGVVVKFAPYRRIVLYQGGFIQANGTPENKIYFTSVSDSAENSWNGIDVSNYYSAPLAKLEFKNVVVRYAYAGLSVWKISDVTIQDSVFEKNNTGIYDNGMSTVNISNTKIINNNIGIYIYQQSGQPNSVYNVNNLSIYGNSEYGVNNEVDEPFFPPPLVYNNWQKSLLWISNLFQPNKALAEEPPLYDYTLDFKNTWWGDASGPRHSANPSGLGDIVSDNVSFNPWLTSDPLEQSVCTTNCNSNILFLPGVMGSRLYDQTGSVECGDDFTGSGCFKDEELWVSSNDSRHEKLALNAQGKSVNNIYTKNDTQRLGGEIDEKGIVDDVYNFNIYESFVNDLRKWKDDEKIIEDYAFVPYDWRLSLEDIITNGATSTREKLSYVSAQDFSQSFILKKLEALQNNSRTGKVTIIAHSNGGLVAKALIQKLKDTNNPLYDKIDKVILVAVPQVGTPDAFVSLLHGSDIGPAGLIMSNERSRQLENNMPTVYNLLPSVGYFTMADSAFATDTLVTFEDNPLFNLQRSHYGIDISDETELKNYILGSDGRTEPSFNDTAHPNTGNSTLYAQAQSVHQILDNWTPSQNTKVIQVAGWGEETLAGLDYKPYVNFWNWNSEEFSYKPRNVIDGDGTVVVPSALWMSTSTPGVERWWVNLDKEGNVFINRQHKDILEVSNLLDFIKSKIQDFNFTDPDNIIVNNTSTLISTDIRRLHYILHSPLTLGITDSQNRYTGMDPLTKEIKQEVPNVTYKQIGDVQFISAPDDIAYTVQMKGYETGSFSLDIEKQQGNEILESSSLQGIPSSTSTIAVIQVVPNALVSDSILAIDQNGDGTVDETLKAKEGEVVVYDIAPPELKVTFDTNLKDVIISAEDAIDKNPIANITKDSITLKDNAGNTTTIPFTKFKESKTKLRFSYNKIIRNGVVTKVPNTNIVYDWQEKKGALTDLDTTVTVKGEEKYIFSYNKAKHTTTIKERINKKTKTTTRAGFVVVTIKTNGDELEVNY